MIPVLVIGYGNPLRSDDGVGGRVAQALLNESSSSKVRVEFAHQLLPEMAAWIAEAEYVVFIDACGDFPPGRIQLRAVPPEETPTASMTHHFSPQGLLADARRLFHRSPEAVMVSVGGGSFDHGEGLSKEVEAAFPVVLVHVKELIQNRLAETGIRG